MPGPSKGGNFQFERWLIPFLIIAFCIIAFAISMTFKKMPPILKRGMQPSDFPQLLLITITLLTIAMFWFDPVRIRGKIQGQVWSTIMMMGLFAALVTVDLFIALGVFAAGLATLWGERRIPILILVGLVVPASIFFLFDMVFEIRFPRGLLTSIWYG